MEKVEKVFSFRDKVIKAGEIYHITQRAPGKESLFVEDNDYLTMLALLKDWCKEFNLDVLSFCLMPNHFHLLLRINEPNLSEAMHSLDTSYALKFNTKYQRKGHVFCGVYRASMCLDDAHLIGSSIYIHLNPQKSGLVKDAFDYRWSSVKIYTNPEIKSFVKNDFILKIIDDDLKNASNLYKSMLKECSLIDYENIIENPRAGINFSKKIFRNLLNILQVKAKAIKKDFIATELSIDEMIEEFKKKKRKNRPEDIKAAVYLIEQLKGRGFNVTEIAKTLDISRQALYNLTNKVEL
jgi:putative transposase